MLHGRLQFAERTADVLLYEEAARETAHLYADADPQMIADFAQPFINQNGYPIDPDAVMARGERRDERSIVGDRNGER